MNKTTADIIKQSNDSSNNKSPPKKYFERHKNKIFNNCVYCLYADTCTPYDACDYLVSFSNNSEEENTKIENIRKKSSPAPHKKMHRGLHSNHTTTTGADPIYQYQVGIINDCLSNIRGGRTGHLYTEQCLKDLFSYEPNATVNFYKGIYYISLQGGQNVESDNIVK